MHGILYYSTISGNTRLVGEALQEFFRIAGITLTLQDVAEDRSWKEVQSAKCKVQNGGMDNKFNSESIKNPQLWTLNFELWTHFDFVLLWCWTYGHGQLEKTMRKCVEETWKNVKLANIPCAAIGLWDHRYDVEYNMYAADLIESWLREHGWNMISPALRINRSPVKPNNQKIIENWAKSFIRVLREI